MASYSATVEGGIAGPSRILATLWILQKAFGLLNHIKHGYYVLVCSLSVVVTVIHVQAMAAMEPLPCAFPFSAEVDGLHYCWYGPDKRSSLSGSLFVYECSIEQWDSKPTTGPAHPALGGGCSVCVGRFLYTFGGRDVSTYFNDLSKLDLDTLQWSTVQTTGSQPIRKWGSILVSVDERTLCSIGGYGIGPIQPGPTFTKSIREDESGWTNEIHLFDVQDGSFFRLWSRLM